MVSARLVRSITTERLRLMLASNRYVNTERDVISDELQRRACIRYKLAATREKNNAED